MRIVNYVRNGRRFGDRKMLTGAKIPKMSLQAYDSSGPLQSDSSAGGAPPRSATCTWRGALQQEEGGHDVEQLELPG